MINPFAGLKETSMLFTAGDQRAWKLPNQDPKQQREVL